MNDRLKDLLYSRISNAGARWTPKAYASGLDLATHIRRVFSLYKINCVLDVGANEGQFRNFLRRRCGYRGRIISFEPTSSTFAVLKNRTSSDPNWRAINWALSSRSGQAEFNVMDDTVFNSFLEPNNTGVESTFIQKHNKVVRKEIVEVRRLDDILAEVAPPSADLHLYLKLDTQGHDFEVLKGAEKSLRSIEALQSEMSVNPMYNGMIGFTEALSKLDEYGFFPSGFFPVCHDVRQRLIEFDCIAVRK